MASFFGNFGTGMEKVGIPVKKTILEKSDAYFRSAFNGGSNGV
jgi:hypothetical protein